MKISELKTGYSVLIRYKFNIKDYTTWLSPFTRFFINLWNNIKGNKICPYNHSGSIILDKGEIWLFEAIDKGFKRTLLTDKIKKHGTNSFILLVPKFQYNEKIFKVVAIDLEDKKIKYNFAGFLLFESIYQLSNERLWLGKKSLNRTVFCSEVDSYLNFMSTDKQLFINYYNVDPEDRYKSELFIKEKIDLDIK